MELNPATSERALALAMVAVGTSDDPMIGTCTNMQIVHVLARAIGALSRPDIEERIGGLADGVPVPPADVLALLHQGST